MYQAYFGLTRNPFEVSPDPGFFLATPQHREALVGLAYGISARKGFLVLTGEVGTGKSLVARCLLEVLDKRRVVYGYMFNSLLSSEQFLHYIAEDLGVTTGPCSKGQLLLRLNHFLIENHQKGLTTVVVIDEAHLLDSSVLEEVRLLTNLETAQGKLLQIVLVGQPELDQKLEAPELRQLKQRITLRFRLKGLGARETRQYVESRLRIAGDSSGTLFTRDALTAIHCFSSGIPRLINTLCDNSLMSAYAQNRKRVTVDVVEEAAADLRLNGVSESGDQAIPDAAAVESPGLFDPPGDDEGAENHSGDESTGIFVSFEGKHEPHF